MTRRSVLFTPADRPEMMRSAAESAADVLVFDLEDAVAPDAKPNAREAIQTVLSDPDFDPDAEVYVRVNPVGLAAGADLDGITPVSHHLDGVMLPKVRSADDVETLGEMLAEHDVPAKVFALIESAAGVLAAEKIAAAGPTVAVAFGAEDLSADIGATRTEEGLEVLHARETVVLAAAAAGVDAIDTVYTDFEDLEGLEAETRFAAQLGYDGKLAIHPAQVDPINRAFTPDPADVEWARRVVEENESTNEAVFQVDGEMIDAPLLAQAERILSRAGSSNSS
ncbi:MAG: HpcH/HpaI aldolase/citrate lyase family protein [Halanaeroarchaeum sp.]